MNRYSIVSIEEFLRKHFFRKRKTLEAIKKRMEAEIRLNGHLTFERTSEIFITKGTKLGERKLRYFLMVDGFIISHLIVRKSYFNIPKTK